jgi:hypothetical protein
MENFLLLIHRIEGDPERVVENILRSEEDVFDFVGVYP